jgi:hypothetical protein
VGRASVSAPINRVFQNLMRRPDENAWRKKSAQKKICIAGRRFIETACTAHEPHKRSLTIGAQIFQVVGDSFAYG